MEVRTDGSPQALSQAAKGAVDALADLTREHIELAKVEMRNELHTTVRRSLWFAAGGAMAGLAAALLVVAVFLLLGNLIESAGARLLILAALMGVLAFALVLRGSVIPTARPSDTSDR
jgi:uncharacterized membrane protein YqjE